MNSGIRREDHDRKRLRTLRSLADQAFSRAAGASLVEGNRVRLLRDAAENYPAWLEAIASARRYIHFENYIIREDEAGEMFATALIAKAQEGVRVRLIYDWLGGVGKTSSRFWNRLRVGRVDVRCYNPPRLDSPFGWLSRNHRKSLSVDGEVGFVAGLCIGQMWIGVPAKKIEPWRDTGIEVRGPAVSDIERAFARIWRMIGEPLPEDEIVGRDSLSQAGDVALRIVGSEPATTELLRLDQLVAALARKRLWLTDAYYAGTTAYVQGLRAAARDGVDVRLLVPNGTDIPVLKPLSRAGYRPLLESGVRVFEWNGTMLHAKTAVADQNWARVGSSNLNIASWLGNCELDAVIENEFFAKQMEEMYLCDLQNATEVVLDIKNKVRTPGAPPHPSPVMTSGGGSAGRAAAGAVRIGNAVGAAFTDRRVLEPVEARITLAAGVLLLTASILFGSFPRLVAYPFAIILLWCAVALFFKSYQLQRKRERSAFGSGEQLAQDQSQKIQS